MCAGQGSRQRLIGRERGYHGVGFGGISVGGMVNNRKFFGSLLAGVDHLPATYDREHQAFTKGEPEWGGHLADALEGIVGLHDASTIAAVIVEPMAGSTGVLPAPKGYLKRLREICDKYGILLIFDEVITGFGRLGAPFAAERYGVQPDMITFAKGVTSGTVPMGGVIVRKHVYDAFMQRARAARSSSSTATPIRAIRSLARRRSRRLTSIATSACSSAPRALEPKWYDAIMSLKGLPNVVDIRCVGLTGAIDLAPIPGSPGERVYRALEHSFFDAGVMIRACRRHDRIDPAAHRQRERDRRDHGQGRGVDQSGGVRARSVTVSTSRAHS